MSTFISLLRPNILILAAIGAFVVVTVPQSEALAYALITSIGTTMFLLGGPPPNPRVASSVVAAIVSRVPGGPAMTGGGTTNKDRIVVLLAFLAAGLIVLLGVLGKLEGQALVNVSAGFVGFIGSVCGKMVDPGDEDTATQEVAIRLIDKIQPVADD